MQISQNNLEEDNYIIAVLMSTYNGEKYIAEQIDSILNQIGVKVRLFIRDDGSNDATKCIIEKYCKKYDAISWVDKGENSNLGVRDSFLRLLSYVYEKQPEIQFFAFADQDDYWLEDKLHIGMQKVLESTNNKGALYYSNKIFVDKNLLEIKREKIVIYNDFLEILWPSLASGCTMIFNRKLARYVMIYSPRNECLHDSWMYRLAKCIGSDILFDENAKILYRQHESNVCGMETTMLHHNIKYMITNFGKNTLKKRKHVIQKFIKELYYSNEKYMTEEAKRNSKIIITYNHNIFSKIKLLFMKGILKRGFKTQMVWVYKVLFNMI